MTSWSPTTGVQTGYYNTGDLPGLYYLLLESGSKLLLENGGGIFLERTNTSVTSYTKVSGVATSYTKV